MGVSLFFSFPSTLQKREMCLCARTSWYLLIWMVGQQEAVAFEGTVCVCADRKSLASSKKFLRGNGDSPLHLYLLLLYSKVWPAAWSLFLLVSYRFVLLFNLT